jgi:hypothetical protein
MIRRPKRQRGRGSVRFNTTTWLLLLPALAGGCQDKPAPFKAADADIKANLSQLGPEDRRLAEQQEYCFVMDGVRLGEMGRPYKVTVRGETAFVCCDNCLRAVREEPDRALAQIEQLKRARANEGAVRDR